MKQTAAEFDKEYLKEKRKKSIIIGAGVVVFISFCALIMYLSLPENMPASENIQGVITSSTTIDTANGKSPAVIIKLNNGEEITLLEADGLTFKENASVVLKKVSSTAGIDTYLFINYTQ